MNLAMRRAVNELAAAAATFVCFRYLANFSSPQAAALTIFGYGFWEVLKKQKDDKEPMTRFRMHVQPHMEEILSDRGLLPDEDTATRFYKHPLPEGKYSVQRDGFTVTFLERCLCYSDDYCKFFEIGRDLKEPLLGLPTDKYGVTPSLFLKRGSDSKRNLMKFDFGIVVPSEERSLVPDSSYKSVVLASLPEACLNDFYCRDNHPWNSVMTAETLNSLLKDGDWTKDEDRHYRFSHRYVTISVEEL